MSRRYRTFIDYFGSELGDLPKKLHGDDEAVLAVLREHPEFTVWDVSTNKLAKTMDRLHKSGRLSYDNSEPFPWSRAIVAPNQGSEP